MYKYFNFFKKIFIFLLFILINIGFIVNQVKASPEENTNNQTNRLFSSKIHINIPTENIKHIPIIRYKLIYKTSYASLLNFLENDIQSLVNELSKLGIKSKNIVIIYKDYEGDNPSKYTLKQFAIKSSLTPEKLANYTTDEGIELNLSNISKKFSIPFLLTKRKVLIGTLVNDRVSLTSNTNLKVVNFNVPDAMGFQVYIGANNKNLNDSAAISKEDIIMNRCGMIQYMNLGINNNTEFIGMMQYYDRINNRYAYFSLPGTLE